ncbi:MAG: hypothetical protein KGO47_04995 [Cyanobacteria bacterium REEB417]|nr:hypothetical protein [Cyanobacteria bacterium REEB417]
MRVQRRYCSGHHRADRPRAIAVCHHHPTAKSYRCLAADLDGVECELDPGQRQDNDNHWGR